MEAIGQLASGVAHDFNNILAATLMHLGLLQDIPELTADMKESLREVEKETMRAANLTRQLLVFGRRQVASRTRNNILAQTIQRVHFGKNRAAVPGQRLTGTMEFGSHLEEIEEETHQSRTIGQRFPHPEAQITPSALTFKVWGSAGSSKCSKARHRAENHCDGKDSSLLWCMNDDEIRPAGHFSNCRRASLRAEPIWWLAGELAA